jgi:hypothetical protein
MDTDLLAEIRPIRQAGSLSNNMPKPWEQFSSQAGQSGPWNQFQTAAPGSPEAIKGLEEAPGSIAREVGVAARPWGPLGAAMGAGALGGGALGVPGGPAGMGAGALAGSGVGATAYAAAHLADLPVMAVNGIGSLFGYNPEFTGPGAAFDNFVNQYNPLPQPESKGEEYLAAASGGIKDAVAGNRAGLALKAFEAPQALRPVFQGMTPTVQKVGAALSDAPVQNMALGGVSGAGAQFGGDITNDSTGGKIAGAAVPVLAAIAGRGVVRGGVNSMGGPSAFGAFGRGLIGQGEDVVMQNGKVIPSSWGISGARQEVARQMAENKVQDQLLGLVGSEADKQAAVSNLGLADVVAGEGFQPTAGSISQNPGLTMAENGLFQSNPAMRARYEANQRAISGSVDNALQPNGAPIEQSQGFISRLLGNMSRSAERNAQQFEDVDMTRANDLVANKKAAVTSSANADQQTASSTAARRQAGDMMVDEKAAYQKLYAAVPRETPITFENSIEAGNAALAEHGANASVDPSIGTARAKIGELMKERIANPETTFGELESDLKIVGSLIDQAQSSGQKQAARLYMMFKDGLVADREAGGAANTALKQANDSFKTFQNRWANGPAGEAMDRGTLPSETMGKYMSSPEGASQYRKTVGTTPAGQQAAGDYLASSVAKGSGANPTKQSVTAAINKNPAISAFPEVKAAEQAKASQIGASTKFQSKQAGKLEQMKGDAAAAKTEAESSLPAKYSQGSSDSAVSSVGAAFSSKDPTAAVRELIKTAGKDKTGKAMEGLQNATREWLGRRLFNKTNAAAGNEVKGITNEDLPTSMAKSADVLNESGAIFKNLKGILPPDEIANLQTNYRRLEIGTRIRKAGSGQSGTSMNEADKSVIENLVKGYTNINAFRAIKTGKTILQDLKTIAGSAFVNSNVNKIIDDIRLQAFLDPDKMKQLLLRPTATNWKRTPWAYQQMNILAQEINRKDDKPKGNEEETSPAPVSQKAASANKASGETSAPRRMRYNPKTGQLESSE